MEFSDEGGFQAEALMLKRFERTEREEAQARSAEFYHLVMGVAVSRLGSSSSFLLLKYALW
jgi:hypothetical protein